MCDYVIWFFSVDRVLSPTYRQVTPLEEQLKELLEKLDLSTAMKHGPSRSKRLKLLKKSIMEVRSELSLKNSFPAVRPSPPCTPSPLCTLALPQSDDQPLTNPVIRACPQPEEPLAPPMLELLTSLSQIDSEAPNASSPDVDLDGDTSTSVLSDGPDGYRPDSPLLSGELYAEASATCNQRTNMFFRKSKSTSPQKSQEATAASVQTLGAKTFLSVVIPRLETLLLPKKRRRSIDSEREEDSPIKRLGTGNQSDSSALCLCVLSSRHCFLFPPGIASGFTVEEELSAAPRLEPRRRCASESSISSSGGLVSNTR